MLLEHCFGGGPLVCRLMEEAERMATAHGYSKIAVISGVGTRNYYRKLGYEFHPGAGQFMIKALNAHPRVGVRQLRSTLLALMIIVLSWMLYHASTSPPAMS